MSTTDPTRDQHERPSRSRRTRTKNRPASSMTFTASSTRSWSDSFLPSGAEVGMTESRSTRKNTPADGGTNLHETKALRAMHHKREPPTHPSP